MMISCDVINHNFGENQFCVNVSILHSYGNVNTKFEVESSIYSRGMTSANI